MCVSEPVSKMSRRDEEDDGSKSGGRSGRIRKKSAKVLEMEEFEEIEKKQFTKKSDGKGKTASTPPGIGPKKVKGKAAGDETAVPGVAAVQGDVLAAGIVVPAVSPVQESAPVATVAGSPVKASTKQAIGAKVREGQGSVIKLLLSSPAIPTTPSVTTNVITKTSPPASVSSSAMSITSTLAPTTKKGTAKVKSEPQVKQESGMAIAPEDVAISIPIKSELMDPQSAHLMLATTLTQDAVSPPQAVMKAEASAVSSESLGSLKLKLMMSPKDTPTLESIVPTSGPIPNLFATSRDETDGPSKNTASSNTTKKKAAPKKKKPAGEKAKRQASSSSKSAAEQMPNLAALVSTPKVPKAVKEERHLSMSDGMDTSLSDTSLDMSSIVESALDMEEEAALVIAEGGTAPSKPKKKKAGGISKKKAKAQPQAAVEMPGFDSGRILLVE